MATRIRLQRHGRKSYAFYSIVIADSRAPRDGKFIEKKAAEAAEKAAAEAPAEEATEAPAEEAAATEAAAE